jgi:hypothetical protein
MGNNARVQMRKRLVLLLALLLVQFGQAFPHTHTLTHDHDSGAATHAFVIDPHDSESADGDHSHSVVNRCKCGVIAASALFNAQVADIPARIESITNYAFAECEPCVPDFVANPILAPPGERPARAPPATNA